MRILGINLHKPSTIVRKLMPKKHVEIPMEFHDDIYNKLSEHKRAFDYFANKYGIDFSFAEFAQKKIADIYCINRNIFHGEGKWAKTSVSPEDSFADSARNIYKTVSEVI